ncbi:hypothetical protein G9A89_014894 [Geosiphon pyriformis]|nr:hypothetical protein G9A89_014894 [Geosiphon pyriformis]
MDSNISKKKAPKSVFHDPAGGSFLQKKKVVLGNVKHSGDEKDVFLISESDSNVYSNVESLSGDDVDIDMSGVSNGSILGSAANTSKVKCINTSTDFGSPFGSPNYDIENKLELLPPSLKITLNIKWIDLKIMKTSVKVAVNKSFALNINLSTVKKKLATAKTQLIRKTFSKICGFGRATTLSKFEEIIQSTFTSENNMKKAISLVLENEITINTNLKRQGVCLNWAVVIKKIPMDMPKEMIIAAKDSMHMAKAVSNWEIWASRNWYRALLFTLPIGTIAYNLGNLLKGAGRKTCFINCLLITGNRISCVVVCFDSDETLKSAFHMELILGSIKLSWARMDVIWHEKCKRFGYFALECDTPVASTSKLSKAFKKVASNKCHFQLARLYKKKSVLISRPTAFSGKTWAQVVSLAGSSDGLYFSSGSDFFFSDTSDLNSGFPLVLADNSSLNVCLASLECSLKLLADQISSILKKLSFVELVLALSLATPTSLVLHLDMDMALDSVLMPSASPFSAAGNVVSDFSSSSSKVLTFKVGSLKSKMVALEVLISLVLEKLDHLCSGLVFTSGLESGYLGLGVAIIMNVFLVQHMCKVSEVSVLGLYGDVTLEKRLAYSHVINSMVAETLNGSIFVVLSGDFNENDSGRSVSFKKFLDLDLLDSLYGSLLHKLSTWFNSRGVQKCIDFILVNDGLRSSSFNQQVYCLDEFFDFDYLVILRYKVSNVSREIWKKFGNLSLAAASMTINDFKYYENKAVEFKGFLNNGHNKVMVEQLLTCFKKLYRFHKFLDSKTTENSQIRAAIVKHIEAFANNKSQIIRSVLEKLFRKVTLNYLIDNKDLVLELDLVKYKVNSIIENWIRKQFAPFNYIDNGVFSGIIKQIDFDEFLLVIKNLPNGKAAGLFGISNKIWKHCDEFWKGVLMNTKPIAFIETARKILSKILSDHILKACSTHNILHGDNFLVLKGTFTQSLIFIVGSVVENALKKNREIWLVLQNMSKAYNSVGWLHLKNSLKRIKMCEKFVRFFGHIYNSYMNRVMTDFGLSKDYKVHDGLDQIDSKFVARMDRIESNAGLTSYLAAGAFMDNIIWVDNCRTVT